MVTICDDQSQTCDTQQQNFVRLNLQCIRSLSAHEIICSAAFVMF